MNQKNRNEIDDKYKWDLTLIFKNDEEWYQEFESLKEKINEVTYYNGKLNNAKDILGYIKLSNNLERRLYKLYYYAHLNFDADTTNPNYQKLKGLIDDLSVKYGSLNSFVNPELLKLDYEVIEKFYDEESELREYEFNLKNLFRFKEHILTEKEENVLATLSNDIFKSQEIYSSLTDSDMKFGTILDENNNPVELTESNYTVYIHSNDRRVRKEAFERMFETYGSFKNTISGTFSGNVDALTNIAKLRHYNSSLEASLFEDNISLDVYNNLIKTVNDNMDTIYKYYGLKKEILNLDELHLYDVYAKLVEDVDLNYTFEEAKEKVINALSVLGEDYVTNLKKAFDEKWIDVYNNVGKRSGAYSSGFYDTKPYILLNFEGKIRDVSTLAHELGHSMHTYYSVKNNPYQYSHYKIFVAEVASTVNELLLSHYMLEHSNNDIEKAYILNELMELYRTTIYRQTMFAEYEKTTHDLNEKGEVLNYELLCNEYYKLNKKYFGDNVVVDGKEYHISIMIFMYICMQ